MSKYVHLNRTTKQVSKSSHQPASTEEQKLAASDPPVFFTKAARRLKAATCFESRTGHVCSSEA